MRTFHGAVRTPVFGRPRSPPGYRRPQWRVDSHQISVLDVFEEVAGLALQHPAHRLEGREPHRLGAPVLQHRDVGRGEADQLREVADAELPLRAVRRS